MKLSKGLERRSLNHFQNLSELGLIKKYKKKQYILVKDKIRNDIKFMVESHLKFGDTFVFLSNKYNQVASFCDHRNMTVISLMIQIYYFSAKTGKYFVKLKDFES